MAGRSNSKVPSRTRVRPPSILVVDDHADNREMYVEYFRHLGFRVASATNGEEALEAARAVRPTVVLMDLAMHGGDGYDATRQLKAEMSSALVVAVSGHADAASATRALEAGCALFIAKPALPADVAKKVFALLDGRRSA